MSSASSPASSSSSSSSAHEPQRRLVYMDVSREDDVIIYQYSDGSQVVTRTGRQQSDI